MLQGNELRLNIGGSSDGNLPVFHSGATPFHVKDGLVRNVNCAIPNSSDP